MIGLLIALLYIPALWILWRIMMWDDKGRTLFSFAVLLIYACSLAAAFPVTMFAYALTHAPSCRCDMVKNHECHQK